MAPINPDDLPLPAPTPPPPPTTRRGKLQQILDRALNDPGLRARLKNDFINTAQSELGTSFTMAKLRQGCRHAIPINASDQEVLDYLRLKVQRLELSPPVRCGKCS